MKQLDNIGNFFRKRLIETEPVELEWNIPSDDIWQAAEPHFPKENQNRRWIILFFFAGISLLTSVLIMNLHSNSSKGVNQINNVANENQKLNENQNETVQERQLLHLNKKDDLHKEEKKISLARTILSETESPSKDFSKSKSKSNVVLDEFGVLDKKKIIASKVNEDDFNSDDSLLPLKNSNSNTFFNANKFLDDQNPSSILAQNPKDIPMSNKSELVNILTLPLQELSALEFSNSQLLSKSPSLVKIEQNQNKSRWEIGLALSQFNRKPDWLIEDLLDEDDMYNLQSRQLGFNLSLTKLVSDRFSYTTGIIFSDLDFDLNIIDLETFGDDVTIEILKKRIQDFVRIGNFSINGNGRDIIIEFLSENDLRKGDVLNLNAEFPINIKLHQIPFILNYRGNKNKWEWNASGGLSLDIVSINVDNINVDVLKDGVNTINPVEVDPISDISLAGSLYLGSGIKYEIYPKLSLGLQSRLDVTELKLSKYELGLFYKL